MNGLSIEVSVLVFILILVRVTTFFSVLPFFGRRMIPGLILIGLSLSITWMWFSGMDQLPEYMVKNQESYLSWFGFAIAAIGEFLIGAMLGLVVGLFVYPIQIAGAYLAQEMGLSMASLSDPATQSNSDVVATLLQSLALMLFFSMDLHHTLVRLLNLSFKAVPVGMSPSTNLPSETAIHQLTQLESIGLSMIGPVGMSLFVVLMSLILLTKAAPSLNIFSIGLSVRIGAGLFFLFLFLPHLFGAISNYFENTSEWLSEFTMLFTPESELANDSP